MTLRRAELNMVDLVDWDRIRFRHRDWRRLRDFRVLALDDPRAHTRRHTKAMFRGTENLDELLIALGAEEQTINPRGDGWDYNQLFFPLTDAQELPENVNRNLSSPDEEN